MENKTLNEQILELYKERTVCFFGSGEICQYAILWFKSQNLPMPVAIIENKVELIGKNFNGIEIISFKQATQTYNDLGIIVTTNENNAELYRQLLLKFKENEVMNLAPKLNIKKTKIEP